LPRLSVNIDHIATLRQARKGVEPEPVAAAVIADLAGADGIIVHLREDRRHIQDRDLRLLRQIVQSKLNLEMAATSEMQRIALEVRPNIVTLVPEKREELTTEGGLDVAARVPFFKEYVDRIQQSGSVVSLFVDPDEKQISASKKTGAAWVELHTGAYANQVSEADKDREFLKITEAAKLAASLGLRPTVDDSGRAKLEVHLFDFAGDLYGRHLRIDFLHKIRDEEKFADLESLKARIAQDCDVAKDFLAASERG